MKKKKNNLYKRVLIFAIISIQFILFNGCFNESDYEGVETVKFETHLYDINSKTDKVVLEADFAKFISGDSIVVAHGVMPDSVYLYYNYFICNIKTGKVVKKLNESVNLESLSICEAKSSILYENEESYYYTDIYEYNYKLNTIEKINNGINEKALNPIYSATGDSVFYCVNSKIMLYNKTTRENILYTDLGDNIKVYKIGFCSVGIGLYLKYNDDTNSTMYVCALDNNKKLKNIFTTVGKVYNSEILFNGSYILCNSMENITGKYYEYFTIIYNISKSEKKLYDFMERLSLSNNTKYFSCVDYNGIYIKSLDYNTLYFLSTEVKSFTTHTDKELKKIIYIKKTITTQTVRV